MLARLLEFYEPLPPARGTVSAVVARRNSRSRVMEMSFHLSDVNEIRVIRSVTFDIQTSAGVSRFTHTEYTIQGNLPSVDIGIAAANIPTRFRGGANNILVVTVTYTDSLGPATATGRGAFTTEDPEQAGSATLVFPNASSMRSVLTDPNGIVSIQEVEFVRPGGSVIRPFPPTRLADGSYQADLTLSGFGQFRVNWTYSDSLGPGKTATATATRSL